MMDEFFWRRAVVLGSAVIYWAGVSVNAARVRRQIGRSPNLKPRGTKERLLWCGWFLVIAIWMGQPLIAGSGAWPGFLQPLLSLFHPAGLVLGTALTVAGYAGTLWCYAAMGASWRIGINRREKNQLVAHGPYSLVRHPIYLFQIVMLFGALLLLPGLLSAAALAVHVGCVIVKASDEEDYLLGVHGQDYRDYCSRSGMLLPNWGRKRCDPPRP
jgi:protein-S-isoprenylcysteine O-methyltransferase Ste14